MCKTRKGKAAMDQKMSDTNSRTKISMFFNF